MQDLKIEYIPVGKVKPYEKNARKHKDFDVDAIVRSIEEFGFDDPIGIWSDKNIIVEGHGRLLAAKKLGMKEVPCIRLDHLTDEQRRAYALAHNKTAENSEWDLELLPLELEEIVDIDMTQFGFEVPEDEPEIEEDEVPDVPDEPQAKLGDIYQLGRHRLMCGDSTSEADVRRLMDGAKADMAFTDPPYGVSYTGGIQFRDGYVEKNNRHMIIGDDIDIYEDVFSILSQYVNGACYIWFADTKAGTLYASAEKYGTIHSMIVWVKNGGYGALNSNYKQKHEPCLYWNPIGTTLSFVGATTETTVWNIDKDGVNKYHPTQKPVALSAKAIRNHDAKTVLDLFGGSGSTLIACEQTNRNCYMMELDPHYVDVILQRYINFKGSNADVFLLKDGKKIPYSEVNS